MGNVNSLKGILLFAVRNGYREVRVSKGLLPVMVSSQGETAYINGIAPVSGEMMSMIRRDYLANNTTLILTVSEQEFFASSVGEELIFRHLPLVTQDRDISTRMASALYSKKGMIVLTASNKEQRFFKLYKAAAYLTENRAATIAIIERSKYFSIRSAHSRLINVYRPELDLNSLIRITGSTQYDCMMVPDMNEEDAVKSLEFVSGEKMVLVSMTWEMAQRISTDKIVYADYIEAEKQRENLKLNIKIDKDVLTENLKGE
jgi:hypothetical protein